MKGPMHIYAAGRIEYSRYRFGVNDCTLQYNIKPERARVAELRKCKLGDVNFVYTGPYTYGCDHGCSHTSDRGTRSHGDGDSIDYDCAVGGHSFNHVYMRALDGIDKCDIFFAWIEDEECFGTILEIGYAKALGKHIVIAHKDDIKPTGELWFAFQSANCSFVADNASDAYKRTINDYADQFYGETE